MSAPDNLRRARALKGRPLPAAGEELRKRIERAEWARIAMGRPRPAPPKIAEDSAWRGILAGIEFAAMWLALIFLPWLLILWLVL